MLLRGGTCDALGALLHAQLASVKQCFEYAAPSASAEQRGRTPLPRHGHVAARSILSIRILLHIIVVCAGICMALAATASTTLLCYFCGHGQH